MWFRPLLLVVLVVVLAVYLVGTVAAQARHSALCSIRRHNNRSPVVRSKVHASAPKSC